MMAGAMAAILDHKGEATTEHEWMMTANRCSRPGQTPWTCKCERNKLTLFKRLLLGVFHEFQQNPTLTYRRKAEKGAVLRSPVRWALWTAPSVLRPTLLEARVSPLLFPGFGTQQVLRKIIRVAEDQGLLKRQHRTDTMLPEGRARPSCSPQRASPGPAECSGIPRRREGKADAAGQGLRRPASPRPPRWPVCRSPRGLPGPLPSSSTPVLRSAWGRAVRTPSHGDEREVCAPPSPPLSSLGTHGELGTEPRPSENPAGFLTLGLRLK